MIWTAIAAGSGRLEYRFFVRPPGQAFQLVFDYSAQNQFPWTPLQDGTHFVGVNARNLDTGEESWKAAYSTVAPIAGSSPVVVSTSHPLVALYSAPPLPGGYGLRVWYRPTSGGAFSVTSTIVCRAGRTMALYVGGMRQSTQYAVRHEVLDAAGRSLGLGPVLAFTTGALTFAVPSGAVIDPPDASTSAVEQTVLLSPIIGAGGVPPFPYAVDLAGRVIWHDRDAASAKGVLLRPFRSGTFLEVLDDDLGLTGRILREIDLTGKVLRQTTAGRVSEQLVRIGQDPIGSFHHEGILLPTGHTAVLASVERILHDVQGSGPVNILGDYVLVLDENWQLLWAWNAFDHLDVTRPAVLGEICQPLVGGCPQLFLAERANDWLHSNSLVHSPADGSLLLSIRHQDWIIKIDYADGLGTGEVLWKLGPQGDFALDSADPFPWFSHQHSPVLTSTGELVVYDNGNTRCAGSTPPCTSRGQVYLLDEAGMTAELASQIPLVGYCSALGSAQVLANGNLHFTSGLLGAPPSWYARSDEVRLTGASSYSLQSGIPLYRSFRMRDLYTPPAAFAAPPVVR